MLLPVWRYLIINTTERILTGPVKRSIPKMITNQPPQGGAMNVRPETIFYPLLEICMAVTSELIGPRNGRFWVSPGPFFEQRTFGHLTAPIPVSKSKSH